jgi:hypothetical protein
MGARDEREGTADAMTAPLLVATVAAVGVLHTLVPDHWAPIVVVGRQKAGPSVGPLALRRSPGSGT